MIQIVASPVLINCRPYINLSANKVNCRSVPLRFTYFCVPKKVADVSVSVYSTILSLLYEAVAWALAAELRTLLLVDILDAVNAR